MKINLPDSVISRQDLRELVVQVRKYAQWYSNVAIKMRVLNNPAYEMPAISPAANLVINEWNKENPISPKSLEELLYALQDFENSVPHMTITLAAPVPGSVKKALLSWCRQNINRNILVDFDFNSTMLGGMVVRYGSHIYDWSFRRQVLNNIQKFPEALRRV